MSMIDFLRACLGAYCLGWLVVEALSSRWAPRVFAAGVVGLVVADLVYHCRWAGVLRFVAHVLP